MLIQSVRMGFLSTCKSEFIENSIMYTGNRNASTRKAAGIASVRKWVAIDPLVRSSVCITCHLHSGVARTSGSQQRQLGSKPDIFEREAYRFQADGIRKPPIHWPFRSIPASRCQTLCSCARRPENLVGFMIRVWSPP